LITHIQATYLIRTICVDLGLQLDDGYILSTSSSSSSASRGTTISISWRQVLIPGWRLSIAIFGWWSIAVIGFRRWRWWLPVAVLGGTVAAGRWWRRTWWWSWWLGRQIGGRRRTGIRITRWLGPNAAESDTNHRKHSGQPHLKFKQ